jgi:hypothetical protein
MVGYSACASGLHDPEVLPAFNPIQLIETLVRLCHAREHRETCLACVEAPASPLCKRREAL